MTRDRVTAEEVKRAIANRISAGHYLPGSRLPSIRTLADELGANRNTVNKAYRALQANGLVELPPGRNTFRVRATPPQTTLLADFRAQAREAVWHAMAGGVAADIVRAELAQIVGEVYTQHELKIRFFECNRHDSDLLSGELSRLTGVPIGAGLIDELTDDSAGIVAAHDLLITTFHHLAEVTRALQHHQDLVVGVDTRPAHAVLLQIARLSPERVGLICSLDNTAVMLRHIISSYQPSCAVETALADDPAALRRIAAEPNVLIVTHTCRDEVVALTGRTPEIVVEFDIDEQSSLFLRQRIQTLRQRKANSATIGAAAAAA